MSLLPAALALLSLQADPTHEPLPGRRKPIAGLEGFHSVSRLDFPDFRLRLTATYVFPDRARWSLQDYDAAAPEADQYFRRGATAYHYATNSNSEELSELGREHVLLQLELRRAVMLHPDGVEWQERAGGVREATLFADSCCHREPIGTLRAETRAGRLTIEGRDRAGEVRETVTIEETQDLRGRRFPRVLSVQGKNGAFRETIETLETRVHYVDLAFVPGDRRQVKTVERAEQAINATDLVPVTYTERELEPGLDWPTALQRAREFHGAAQKALPAGVELDPIPTIEVSREGKPRRCLLRLRTALTPPPEGFVHQGERMGLAQVCGKLEDAGKALDGLVQAVPAEAHAGKPYVRVHSADRIEVVLPLSSE